LLLDLHDRADQGERCGWPTNTLASAFANTDRPIATGLGNALREKPKVTQPIEPFIRTEESPDDTVVVVRAGPLTAEKIVEHAERQMAVFSYRGAPMASISVDLCIGAWKLERVLAERMWSRSRYAVTTVGALRMAKYELVPTNAAPHYDIVLRATTMVVAEELLAFFGPTMENPYKKRQQRGRWQ
jgi:hypothetical protein